MKVSTIPVLVALLALGACGKKSEEPVKPMAEEAEARAEQADRRIAIEGLRDAARDLQRGDDPQHRAVVSALRDTADALRPLAKDNANARTRVDNIVEYADRIERTHVSSKEHAAWVRSALNESAVTLATIAEARGRDDFLPWVHALQARAEAIDPAEALADQSASVSAAFEDLAEAIRYLSTERKEEDRERG